MLLSIFKGNIESKQSLETNLNQYAMRHVNEGFSISVDIPPKEQLDAVGFVKDGIALFVWKTYNLKLAKQALNVIGYEGFDLLKFDHSIYFNWFEISSQLMECEYEFQNIEKKATAFDLKRLDAFMKRARDSTINSATFTLSDYDVIITARTEGRLSISPDVDDKTLLNILRFLLSDTIRRIVI